MATDFVGCIAVDFDGVLHSYERGWQGGEIYGHVTKGFWDWCMALLHEAEIRGQAIELCIYSSRSKDPKLREEMRKWVLDRAPTGVMPYLTFRHEKPPAWVTIDDRGIQFNGSWDAPELAPAAILDFKPWMSR